MQLNDTLIQEAADGPQATSKRTLPFDIWVIIIDIMTSEDDVRRHVVPLTQVCKDMNYVAEQVLYRHVSVGPDLFQLHSFFRVVCERDHRAAAVRTLRVRLPEVASTSFRRSRRQKVSGYAMSAALPSRASVDESEVGNLLDTIVQAFGRLVNLIELDLDDNELFPLICASSAFQLTELTTSSAALLKGMSTSRSREGHLPERSPKVLSTLITIQKLALNLFNPCIKLSDLHVLPITHLFLDRVRFVSTTLDLTHSLHALPNLVSLRVMWSAHHEHKSIVSLWPTRILGMTPLPRLRRLELCERRVPQAFVR